jgi:hemolysin III
MDPKEIAQDWYNRRLSDGGPIYTETNPDHMIVEPWNAISSLLIVIPALIWLIKVWGQFKDYKFLLYAIPLMILGGTGSTLFHAFRASRFFLVMDVLPTAILTLSMSIYFWIKIFKRWWYVLIVIALSFGIRFLLFGNVPSHTAINISYAITGIMTGLPLVLILFRTKFYKLNYVVTTILFFILALVFRELDAYSIPFLPMGTHFLWHAFTGIGAYYILAYLYYFRKREINSQSSESNFNLQTT